MASSEQISQRYSGAVFLGMAVGSGVLGAWGGYEIGKHAPPIRVTTAATPKEKLFDNQIACASGLAALTILSFCTVLTFKKPFDKMMAFCNNFGDILTETFHRPKANAPKPQPVE